MSGLKYTRTVELHGVKIPFVEEIFSDKLRRTLEKGKYEIGECRRMDAIVFPGDKVLELGAGVGLVSAIAARKTEPENVICVEANPKLIPLIEETHRINGRTGVQVMHGVAVPQDDGTPAMFYIRADFWGSSMVPGPDAIEEIEVPKIDIAALVKSHRPDILTMDIEGAEAALVAGIDLSPCRVVMMELHPKVYGHPGTAGIFRQLDRQGFTYDAKNSRGGSVIVFNRFTPARMGPKVCAVTCMKNEGPFVLEWVAYHRAIGVTDFLVFTNDCDDGTTEILDRLDAMGIVRHLPNPSSAIGSNRHQGRALEYARYHSEFRDADWVVSMDVDEFINVHVGKGTLGELFEACDGANVISLSHLDFGSGGIEAFEDDFVMSTFMTCADPKPQINERRGIKTFINRSAPRFRLSNHRPFFADPDDPDLRWVNGSGRGVGPRFRKSDAKGLPTGDCYALAQINHYPVRSMESYLAKSERGNVVVPNCHVGLEYWSKRDCNETEETSIFDRVALGWDERVILISDPQLKSLHNAAVNRHRQKIEALKLDPEMTLLLDEIRNDTAARMGSQEAATGTHGPGSGTMGGPKPPPPDASILF